MDWTPPPKPTHHAENQLVSAILEGYFSPGSFLPAERELAARLGVTRPTLREALQRLARDGWLEIQHGKPTRVRDYLQEGNLAVLGAIVAHRDLLPPNFVDNLLAVRQLLAPTYIRLAIARAPDQVIQLLIPYATLPDTPDRYAEADWNLHHQMCILSGNPVFTLILNGFSSFYVQMASRYFSLPVARQASQQFYIDLLHAAQDKDEHTAAIIAEQMMHASLSIWHEASRNGGL